MTKQIQDAYIVAATRTPVGKAPKGVFRNTRPDDMLAHVLKSVVAQAPGIDLNRIDDAIIGCAMPEGEQGMNVARIGVLLAGLPDVVAAQTINRFCSSGLQAVAMAADQIRLGNADLMLAGGTESMSMVPMMGNKIAMAPSVFDNDHVAIAYGMGITAEKVAEEWKVSREDQDAFALASHQKAIAAIQAGEFKDEISPYDVRTRQPDLADGRRIAVTGVAVQDLDGRPLQLMATPLPLPGGEVWLMLAVVDTTGNVTVDAAQTAVIVADELHIQVRREDLQRGLVVEGHGMALGGGTEQAVERAGIQHVEAEASGDAMRDGALAGAAGTVDGDHRHRRADGLLFDFCTHCCSSLWTQPASLSLAEISRPQRRARPRKSGKLVATLAQSRASDARAYSSEASRAISSNVTCWPAFRRCR